MQKTLGGDRLGSGKKMKVDLHGYERSTHDLGYVFRSTMSAGTLVPFLKEIALPGDTFDINLNCEINTHPTVGPLFGGMKVQLDIFEAPLRLYQGQLHNNKLGIGMNMAAIKLPVTSLFAPNTEAITDYSTIDMDNYQINPSSILSYLGIRGVGTYAISGGPGEMERTFNAVPWIAYWDIYKNYYSNKQEEIGAVIHTGSPSVVEEIVSVDVEGSTLPQTNSTGGIALGLYSSFDLTNSATYQPPGDVIILVQTTTTVAWYPLLYAFGAEALTPPTLQQYFYNGIFGAGANILAWDYADAFTTDEIGITTFPLSYLDDIREDILAEVGLTVPYNVYTDFPQPPFDLIYQDAGGKKCYALNQEGLALKTYQSDLLNNWLSTEWIDGVNGISALTAIDTSSGSFQIDTLNLSKKVYEMLNRVAVSGGTYDDWQEVQYDHPRYTRAETPVYHGGLIKELVFQEVVSNSATTIDANQPLGTLAGKGVMSNKHKGGSVTIKVNEPSYIIGIVSITPRIDYSQGNDWDIHLETIDDLHKPALDEIGFQELITERMAWWDTNHDGSSWVTKSAGKQPAWIEYMTNINRVRGNFAVKDNEMFMTLNRRYEPLATYGTTNTITIKDLTTYIDPRKVNHIFAATSLDSQNFWTQIGIDMKVRRKMSAKIMPNL